MIKQLTRDNFLYHFCRKKSDALCRKKSVAPCTPQYVKLNISSHFLHFAHIFNTRVICRWVRTWPPLFIACGWCDGFLAAKCVGFLAANVSFHFNFISLCHSTLHMPHNHTSWRRVTKEKGGHWDQYLYYNKTLIVNIILKMILGCLNYKLL